MSKEAAPEPEELAEGADAAVKKKMSGKTLILFIVLPLLVVVGGGAAAFTMLSGGKKADAEAHGEADAGHGKDKKDAKKDAKKDDGHGAKPAAGDGHGGAEGGGEAVEVGTLRVGEAGEPSYYTMPDLLVNLATTEGDQQVYLQLKLTLEAQDVAVFDGMDQLMPRVSDQLNMFLRQLRVDDLNGSSGAYRLRLELLRRINVALAPQKIDAVLIEEMLVR